MTRIGQRMKLLRKSFNDTQSSFAERIGFDLSSVQYYENHPHANPSFEVLRHVAEKCHVSVEWFNDDSSFIREVGLQYVQLTREVEDLKARVSKMDEMRSRLDDVEGFLKSLEGRSEKEKPKEENTLRKEQIKVLTDVPDKAKSTWTSLPKEPPILQGAKRKVIATVALHKEKEAREREVASMILPSAAKPKAKAAKPIVKTVNVTEKKGRKDSKMDPVYRYKTEKRPEDVEYVPKIIKNENQNPRIKALVDKGMFPVRAGNLLRQLDIYDLRTLVRVSESDIEKLHGMGPMMVREIKDCVFGWYGVAIPVRHESKKDDFIDVRLVGPDVQKFMRQNSIHTYRDFDKIVKEMGKTFYGQHDDVRAFYYRFGNAQDVKEGERSEEEIER